jgi:hypothetical protein
MAQKGEGDDFLRKALEETCPDGQVVTHWLMVMETFDGDEQNLHIASSDSVTPWMALGMLEAAKRIVSDDGPD